MKLCQALRLTPGDVVAFVGGGGKTTAMFRLADELAGRHRVLTTTTTRIFAVQISRSPAHVTFDPARQSLADILPQLHRAIDQFGQVLLIGQADSDSGKAFGVSPEAVSALCLTGQFDIILNEADGSRMRPFKAPAEHEPVIPANSSLVVPVVGLDILQQPLTSETVHRAERVSQLSETPIGEPVTIDTVTAILSHPAGGLKSVPPSARVIPLLNKATDSARLTAGQQLACQLLAEPRIEVVAIGAGQHQAEPIRELHSRTGAVILAAGGSSRFGSPKQLAPWGDKTFLEQVVDTALASAAEPVVVVLGAEVEQSLAMLANRPVRVVINKDWAAGQSSSMKAGLSALPTNVSSGVFLLVDMPAITPTVIEALIQRHRETLAPVVWPEFAGQRGNPVLFDRALFPQLMTLQGDTGGRAVLLAYSSQAERVIMDESAILRDIDHPEDY